jgi:hypothetical protein
MLHSRAGIEAWPPCDVPDKRAPALRVECEVCVIPERSGVRGLGASRSRAKHLLTVAVADKQWHERRRPYYQQELMT